MFPDYEKLVIAYYRWKKKNNKLPSELIHPAQARLKKESLRKCKDEFLIKDDNAIRDFCGARDLSKPCLQALKNSEPDKFRALSNFLKSISGEPAMEKGTDPKNIGFLAWLIDFPIRPFIHGKNYENITLEDLIQEEPDGDLSGSAENGHALTAGAAGVLKVTSEKETVSKEDDTIKRIASGNSYPERQKKWTRKSSMMVIIALLLVFATGSAWWWKGGNHNGCMYWTGDQYQAIDCNEKIRGVRIIALDTVRLKYFKRVTRPDTITYYSAGRLWYSKIGGKVDFYTDSGEHPEVFNYYLKRVTKHMIDTYVYGKIASK